jgi:hypothetical protein
MKHKAGNKSLGNLIFDKKSIASMINNGNVGAMNRVHLANINALGKNIARKAIRIIFSSIFLHGKKKKPRIAKSEIGIPRA